MSYDDLAGYLSGSDLPARKPFALVPEWLIGAVPASTLEVYVSLGRLFGSDGWCWCSHDGYRSRFRPISWGAFKTALDALEKIGAIAVFTTRKSDGHQGPHAFYRLRTLEPIRPAESPLALNQPTRLRTNGGLATLTPRIAGITITSKGITRTVDDNKPKDKRQPAKSRDLARGERGRFVSTPDRALTVAVTEPDRDFHRDPDRVITRTNESPSTKTRVKTRTRSVLDCQRILRFVDFDAIDVVQAAA